MKFIHQFFIMLAVLAPFGGKAATDLNPTMTQDELIQYGITSFEENILDVDQTYTSLIVFNIISIATFNKLDPVFILKSVQNNLQLKAHDHFEKIGTYDKKKLTYGIAFFATCAGFIYLTKYMYDAWKKPTLEKINEIKQSLKDIGVEVTEKVESSYSYLFGAAHFKQITTQFNIMHNIPTEKLPFIEESKKELLALTETQASTSSWMQISICGAITSGLFGIASTVEGLSQKHQQKYEKYVEVANYLGAIEYY